MGGGARRTVGSPPLFGFSVGAADDEEEDVSPSELQRSVKKNGDAAEKATRDY